jgi:hypothetical protein
MSKQSHHLSAASLCDKKKRMEFGYGQLRPRRLFKLTARPIAAVLMRVALTPKRIDPIGLRMGFYTFSFTEFDEDKSESMILFRLGEDLGHNANGKCQRC